MIQQRPAHPPRKLPGAARLLLGGAFAAICWAAAAQAADQPFFSRYPLIDKERWYISHGWANGEHQSCEWRADHVTAEDGHIRLHLTDKGGKLRPIGCAEVQSTARTRYGRYEARMRTAAGSGLNTAFFTYIGPPNGVAEHDEIDFEFLGKDPRTVQVTYWRKGKSAPATIVPLGFDASAGFHDYAFEWSPREIRWYVDGRLVHSTPKNADLPRNPSRTYFSLWSGSAVEDDWLGSFKYKSPATAEIAWTRYTPLAESSKP
ncbi:MAG TPA: family 16 glycosylhydrolase [Patescibacteria group bacterium]|nr:family 16 glycosylhydrolase [Patescibacteria group bacterium]